MHTAIMPGSCKRCKQSPVPAPPSGGVGSIVTSGVPHCSTREPALGRPCRVVRCRTPACRNGSPTTRRGADWAAYAVRAAMPQVRPSAAMSLTDTRVLSAAARNPCATPAVVNRPPCANKRSRGTDSSSVNTSIQIGRFASELKSWARKTSSGRIGYLGCGTAVVVPFRLRVRRRARHLRLCDVAGAGPDGRTVRHRCHLQQDSAAHQEGGAVAGGRRCHLTRMIRCPVLRAPDRDGGEWRESHAATSLRDGGLHSAGQACVVLGGPVE